MDVDVLIVGGGIAGLWALDHLRQSGYRAYLVENRALGFGQTITSQGIIHGGLKYSLRGMLTASAGEIREMPLIWRDCLSGQREPNLSSVQIRSQSCYLWQTSALSSQAAMLGAQLNLRVKPQPLAENDRPELLQSAHGQVFRLEEQVLSPASLLNCFRSRNQSALWQIDEQNGLEFQFNAQRQVESVQLLAGDRVQVLKPRCVVMTAGLGNELLSLEAGRQQMMQRRPLHMALVRGPLPAFQGHCVDGAKTRLTITSEAISAQETVWQLGGQLAELGVSMTPEEFVRQAAQELQATLPGLSLEGLKFATYRVDRAEKRIAMGLRPDSPQVLRHKNVITCWPTKLAFAPRSAEMIQHMLQVELKLRPTTDHSPVASDWPVPEVAQAPWETAEQWYRVTEESVQQLPQTSPQRLAA